MKYAIIIVLLVYSFGSYAQDDEYDRFGIPWSDGKIIHTEVIQVPNKKKHEIFNSARLWFSETYQSSKQVLDIDDREAGILSGRAWTEVTLVTVDRDIPFRLWYTVIIETKDDRYRYQVKDFEFEPFSPIDASSIFVETVLSRSSMFETDGQLNLKSFDFFVQYKEVSTALDENLQKLLTRSGLSDDW